MASADGLLIVNNEEGVIHPPGPDGKHLGEIRYYHARLGKINVRKHSANDLSTSTSMFGDKRIFPTTTYTRFFVRWNGHKITVGWCL